MIQLTLDCLIRPWSKTEFLLCILLFEQKRRENDEDKHSSLNKTFPILFLLIPDKFNTYKFPPTTLFAFYLHCCLKMNKKLYPIRLAFKLKSWKSKMN